MSRLPYSNTPKLPNQLQSWGKTTAPKTPSFNPARFFRQIFATILSSFYRLSAVFPKLFHWYCWTIPLVLFNKSIDFVQRFQWNGCPKLPKWEREIDNLARRFRQNRSGILAHSGCLDERWGMKDEGLARAALQLRMAEKGNNNIEVGTSAGLREEWRFVSCFKCACPSVRSRSPPISLLFIHICISNTIGDEGNAFNA